MQPVAPAAASSSNKATLHPLDWKGDSPTSRGLLPPPEDSPSTAANQHLAQEPSRLQTAGQPCKQDLR